MLDALAQIPTWIGFLLALFGGCGLLTGLVVAAATRPKTRRRRVAVAFTVLAGLSAVASLTIHSQQEDAKWEAVTAAVNEKYGADLSVEQVHGLSSNSANWLTIHGDRVACVFEYEVSNVPGADPVVESVHLVCGEELAFAG